MDTVTKDRLDRAFRAFSQHGDYITFDTYTGQAQALAEASGKDPESPAVRDLRTSSGPCGIGSPT